MKVYIFVGVFLPIGIYLLVQGIRCSITVKAKLRQLSDYDAKKIQLSYGDMSYVDKGKGEVILSIHGIFGGYDQAFDGGT